MLSFPAHIWQFSTICRHFLKVKCSRSAKQRRPLVAVWPPWASVAWIVTPGSSAIKVSVELLPKTCLGTDSRDKANNGPPITYLLGLEMRTVYLIFVKVLPGGIPRDLWLRRTRIHSDLHRDTSYIISRPHINSIVLLGGQIYTNNITARYHRSNILLVRYHQSYILLVRYHQSYILWVRYHQSYILWVRYHQSYILLVRYHQSYILWVRYHQSYILLVRYHQSYILWVRYHQFNILWVRYHQSYILWVRYHQSYIILVRYHPTNILWVRYHPTNILWVRYHPTNRYQ